MQLRHCRPGPRGVSRGLFQTLRSDAIEVVLVMLLAVVISGYLTRTLQPWLPLPLPVVQIGLGAVIAGVSGRV